MAHIQGEKTNRRCWEGSTEALDSQKLPGIVPAVCGVCNQEQGRKGHEHLHSGALEDLFRKRLLSPGPFSNLQASAVT